MVAGGIVAVVLAVGVYALTRGDGGIIPDIPIIDSGPDTPTLAFDRVAVKVEPTTDTEAKKIDVGGPAERTEALLTDFYQQVWIDPDVWEDGDYAGVFDEVMSGDVIEAAQKELEALTLGPDAGATYAFVEPKRSTMTISVLTDADDRPAQIMVAVTFTASAEHEDGSFTDIAQEATYFVADLDGDWRIISFDASRREVAGEAPASATPTAEAS